MLQSSIGSNQGYEAASSSISEDDKVEGDGFGDKDPFVQHYVEDENKHLKLHRVRLTKSQIQDLLNTYNEVHQYLESHQDSKRMKAEMGFTKTAEIMTKKLQNHRIDEKQVRYYVNKQNPIIENKLTEKDEFEQELLNRLIFFRVEAEELKYEYKWRNNASISELSFNDNWIHSFLDRWGLVRRAITHVENETPPEEEFRMIMRSIQDTISMNNYPKSNIINIDETAVMFNAVGRFRYIPIGERRASMHERNEKQRFTAILGATADGLLLPSFILVKDS